MNELNANTNVNLKFCGYFQQLNINSLCLLFLNCFYLAIHVAFGSYPWHTAQCHTRTSTVHTGHTIAHTYPFHKNCFILFYSISFHSFAVIPVNKCNWLLINMNQNVKSFILFTFVRYIAPNVAVSVFWFYQCVNFENLFYFVQSFIVHSFTYP